MHKMFVVAARGRGIWETLEALLANYKFLVNLNAGKAVIWNEMKCIRTVSWWHMYTDNMNIHWHQTAHLYLTLQILLVIQSWQSGFQRDCRADAAGALLQFISGFRSPTLYLSPWGLDIQNSWQVQQFHRQAEEREDQVRHQHAGTWSLSSPLGGQASKWAGQGPTVNCAQKDGVISIQQVSQIVAKTLWSMMPLKRWGAATQLWWRPPEIGEAVRAVRVCAADADTGVCVWWHSHHHKSLH